MDIRDTNKAKGKTQTPALRNAEYSSPSNTAEPGALSLPASAQEDQVLLSEV